MRRPRVQVPSPAPDNSSLAAAQGTSAAVARSEPGYPARGRSLLRATRCARRRSEREAKGPGFGADCGFGSQEGTMDRHDRIEEQLARVPLFEGLSKKELKLVSQLATPLE